MRHFPILVILFLLHQSVAQAQNLLVPDSTADRVLLLSGNDGTVLNSNFLDIATQAANAGVNSTAIEALEVGNEFWVSDQVADRIWRFARNGNFIGDIGAGQLNNIRGMEVVGDTVYVAQGSASASFGEGIITIDVPSAQVTGVFNGRPDADTSYWDVFLHNNELLVTNSDSGNDGIERYSLDGDLLGFFDQSDGETNFDFLQQLNRRQSNDNLLGGGFSGPSGVYEFLSDGTNLGIVAALDFGPRAAFELANGEILWTNGARIGTDSVEVASGGSFRFISTTSIPEPNTGILLLVVITSQLTLGRRRRAT